LDVQKTFSEVYKVRVFYSRMSKLEGNIIINQEDYNEDFKKKLKETPLTLNGVTLEVIEAEGEDLKNFFSKHGNHYQTCLQRYKNPELFLQGRNSHSKKSRERNNYNK